MVSELPNAATQDSDRQRAHLVSLGLSELTISN